MHVSLYASHEPEVDNRSDPLTSSQEIQTDTLSKNTVVVVEQRLRDHE